MLCHEIRMAFSHEAGMAFSHEARVAFSHEARMAFSHKAKMVLCCEAFMNRYEMEVRTWRRELQRRKECHGSPVFELCRIYR